MYSSAVSLDSFGYQVWELTLYIKSCVHLLDDGLAPVAAEGDGCLSTGVQLPPAALSACVDLSETV